MRTYTPERLAEAARICGEVYGVEPYARAVRVRMDVGATTARNLIQRARQAGHDIPDDLKTWRYAFPAPELLCVCGWSCSPEYGLQALAKHTWVEHSRKPSDVERTPRVAS